MEGPNTIAAVSSPRAPALAAHPPISPSPVPRPSFPAKSVTAHALPMRMPLAVAHAGSRGRHPATLSPPQVHIETIPGSGGVLLPPRGYVEGVRALCDKYEILMIADEVWVAPLPSGIQSGHAIWWLHGGETGPAHR